ncbi:MAG: DUF4337 family protein [Polyangiaceae bacterium]
MSGAHEIAEQIEHAAHNAGHGDPGVARMAGITMAILGVMLALCSAMVGGERTDLISTMVDQSNTYGKYQAQRMKFRMTMVELATLHALSPSHKDLDHFGEILSKMKPNAGKAPGSDVEVEVDAIGESTKALVAILQPRTADIERTLAATKRYSEQLEAAQAWAESYDEAVHAHFEASEHYEWGQLAAEIGIVVASVALLLANRKAWYMSVAAGSLGAVTLVWTFTVTRGELGHANKEIAATKAKYSALRHAGDAKGDDAELMADVQRKLTQLKQGEPAPTGKTP